MLRPVRRKGSESDVDFDKGMVWFRRSHTVACAEATRLHTTATLTTTTQVTHETLLNETVDRLNRARRIAVTEVLSFIRKRTAIVP